MPTVPDPPPPDAEIVIGDDPITVKDVHEAEPEQDTEVVATPNAEPAPDAEYSRRLLLATGEVVARPVPVPEGHELMQFPERQIVFTESPRYSSVPGVVVPR